MNKNRFNMLAHTGPVLKSFFWGRFVVDISGIRTPRGKKMAALREHNPLRAVGVIDGISKQPKALNAEGFFVSSKDGKECLALIEQGFPMQSSISIEFDQIEEVKDQETVSVNGGFFSGPGVVVRESNLREISMCSLGADDQTSVSSLNATNVITRPDENQRADDHVTLQWDTSPELRHEFDGNFEAYQSYLSAVSAGRVRVYGAGHDGNEIFHNLNNSRGETMQKKMLPGQRAGESLQDYIDRSWKSEPGVQEEFSGNFERYQAYFRALAAGRVRILGRTK